MTTLLPGTEVQARGLRWEVVDAQALGLQVLYRLRGMNNKAFSSLKDYYAPTAVTHQPEALEPLFRMFADQWLAETRFQSSLTAMIAHPAYRAIASMGRDALPLILSELETKPDHWFAALRDITGEDPVETGERGDLTAMTAAWLRWAKAAGLSW